MLVKSIGFTHQRRALNLTRRKQFIDWPQNKFKTESAEQEYRLLLLVDWNDKIKRPIF